MSFMKRFAEQVSIDMGYDGEINSHVLEEAQRRLEERINEHETNQSRDQEDLQRDGD